MSHWHMSRFSPGFCGKPPEIPAIFREKTLALGAYLWYTTAQ